MRYKLLGRSGLRVSELCLGTMTFGTEWPLGADEITSRGVFDAFTEAGGNFLDTANRYTEGTSERWLGEWIADDRDHYVLATKFSLLDRRNDLNFAGNHRKNMVRSVETSLKRLNTDYIDLLWLHAWDFTTPVDEVMRGLDDLISAGKVHHIGISDTPAWIVAQANTIAQFRGWAQFVGLQVEYSLIQRTPERDLLPMAKAFGMTLTPWAPLAGGALTGKYLKPEAQGRVPEHSLRRNDRSTNIVQTVVNIAAEIGVPASQVAINWTRQRSQSVIPIVGARRPDQIKESLGCVDFQLSDAQMTQLNEVSAIEMGFPHDFLAADVAQDLLFGGMRNAIDL